MLSEQDLISRIAKALPSGAAGRSTVGIGDDAAVWRTRPGHEAVLTCDFSLEGRHFLREIHSPDSIGWKSLARATSDIAAMGARPKCFLLSLALPAELTDKWLDEFLGGTGNAARKFGLVIAGGDTTLNETVIVSITVVGEIRAGQAITRGGARPGDLICVSGSLGEAQLGLEMLRSKRYPRAGVAARNVQQHALLRKHLYPEPRLALGQWLAENRLATAMIDVSDGLSTDLGHICESSGVGARLFAEKIPTAEPAKLRGTLMRPRPMRKHRGTLKARGLELALHAGEDYELLFTVTPRAAKRLPQKHRTTPLAIIGEITTRKSVELADGSGHTSRVLARGWDPFRSSH